MKFPFDIKNLSLCAAVGATIKIITLAAENKAVFISILNTAMIGLVIGLLIQITYMIVGNKIRSSMLWTNIIVCLNISLVVIIYNVINGITDFWSYFVALSISLLAGVIVVFSQNAYYKKANKRLQEKKLALIEQNKRME